MSTDERNTKELVETLEDGRKGYEQCAEKLQDSSSPEAAASMTRLAEQRRQLSTELRQMAKSYGDTINESGTTTASVHRGWIALKDALTGADPKPVLRAAVQGEEHAISEYEKALEQDLSPSLREVVVRQLGQIRSARDEVKALAER
ncbi:MAG: PA2169 family four-helix-bundle protein [Thermoleophilia bacterium]|nr:PA2169 family four-helix-bundle protein [Thermoleophilia bacterium]